MNFKTPEELLSARMKALEEQEFALIYDTFHDDAPFKQHFPSRTEYLAFAEQQLRAIEITDWKIMGQRPAKGDVEIVLWMRMGEGQAAQDLFELALLIETGNGWRYHSAQKLTREDYTGPVEQIDFIHFDQAEQKIRF